MLENLKRRGSTRFMESVGKGSEPVLRIEGRGSGATQTGKHFAT